MKRKSVAAVLSAVVFPGIGQYYLGQRVRALLFLAPAAVAGVAYLRFALDQANAVVDRVMSGSVGLDPAAIAAQLEAQPTPAWVTVAGVVFLASWAASVADALWSKRG